MDEKPLRLGGMALRNGLFVHGPTHWAVAIRAEDGTIRVASGAKPLRRGPLDRVPIVRGVARMGEMFAILPRVKRALPEAKLAYETPTLAFSAVTTTVLAAAARRRLHPAAAEAITGMLALLPGMIALRSGPLARYHGAEHKIVGGYETGSDPAEATKEHERCGSHLVAPLLVSSLIGSTLAGRAAPEHRRAARAGAGLASAGVAMELVAWGVRNADRRAARILAWPGYTLQRVIATREPQPDELEVARAALDRLLAEEGVSGSAPPSPPRDVT